MTCQQNELCSQEKSDSSVQSDGWHLQPTSRQLNLMGSLFVFIGLWLLLVADLLVDSVHILVSHGCVERILDVVAWHGEAPHPWPAVDLLTIRAVAKWMLVIPIRLIVDHAPLVFVRHVAQAMIVVRGRVRPLPVTVR